jgi:hypothetical protein
VNLALPAFVILLALLPGIACFYGYFAGRFDKRTAGVSGFEELALYVVLAIPIDAVALWVCRWFGIDLDFGVVTRLLLGGSSDSSVADVVGVFRRSWALSSRTYFAILVFGFLLGSFGRRTVWACRLDTMFSILRLRHQWFYVLQGRLRDMPRGVLAYVDVLTNHPDGSRLYRGLVVDFEISSTGAIDSLTLRDARRGHGRAGAFTWKDIPSSRLALMGSTIHSINMTYVALDIRPRHGWRRIWYDLRAFFRSFLFQEP